ncbi:MAG: hypothetical protein K2F73_07215, partial [Ruminococcus sp.]|nr:hypothetical protein [Ruminococcus sp.]
LNEAKDVVVEARKSIDTNASQDIKKMEAPKVDMSDVKSAAEKVKTPAPVPAPAPVAPKKPVVNNPVQSNNSAKSANNNLNGKNNAVKPAPAPAPAPVKPQAAQSKPQPKKKNFSFDMSGMDELLKAAEAEAKNSNT